MRLILTFLFLPVVCVVAFGQNTPPQTKIMTLGVFHFAYYNADAVKTEEKDKISVLEEPYQSEIIAISNAISKFRPTRIAIEFTPDQKARIDSLYAQYLTGNYKLGKSEVYQLGFRIAKNMELQSFYCVDDWGKAYDNINGLLNDSIRSAKLEDYYFHSPDSIYKESATSHKVTGILDELYRMNEPEFIKERLAPYLLNPFKYEEQPGDFAGVDFETGRWFNRNLRIFRNIQRIPYGQDERILLIIGSDHLNLLNLFFEASKEFEFVSPLPYLDLVRKDK